MKVNPRELLNLWWLISFLLENFMLFCWTLLRVMSQVRPCKKPQIFRFLVEFWLHDLFPQLKLFVFWVTPIFGPFLCDCSLKSGWVLIHDLDIQALSLGDKDPLQPMLDAINAALRNIKIKPKCYIQLLYLN